MSVCSCSDCRRKRADRRYRQRHAKPYAGSRDPRPLDWVIAYRAHGVDTSVEFYNQQGGSP